MSDRVPHDQMAYELDKLVYGKTCWLADFASGRKRRPDHEVETKRRELTVLRQAAADYRAAAERAA